MMTALFVLTIAFVIFEILLIIWLGLQLRAIYQQEQRKPKPNNEYNVFRDPERYDKER